MLDSTTFNSQIIEGGGGNTPFFSLIILSYNKEPFIRKCLESCFNQTFKDFEIIVVDDCSQDNTPSILHEYQAHKNLTIIQNSSNSGAFASRIIGEEYAKGEYIIHIDGDDFVKETMCEVLYPLCKTNQWDIIGFGCINIDLQNREKNTRINPIGFISSIKLSKKIISAFIWGKAFKKNLIKKTNTFINQNLFRKPVINMSEDLLKFTFILYFYPNYYGLNEYLYFYRCNLDSITGNCNDIFRNKLKINDINLSISILKKINQTYIAFEDTNKEAVILLTQLKDNFQYIYYHSKAYEDKPFAYPINFLKSLWYVRSPKVFGKTIVRIFIYLATLGKVRI